jgi:hypothetical protein
LPGASFADDVDTVVPLLLEPGRADSTGHVERIGGPQAVRQRERSADCSAATRLHRELEDEPGCWRAQPRACTTPIAREDLFMVTWNRRHQVAHKGYSRSWAKRNTEELLAEELDAMSFEAGAPRVTVDREPPHHSSSAEPLVIDARGAALAEARRVIGAAARRSAETRRQAPTPAPVGSEPCPGRLARAWRALRKLFGRG